MQPSSPSHYEVLGLPLSSTMAEIRRRYHELSLVHHPDKQPNTEDTKNSNWLMISEAYTTLSDPESRSKYDALLQSETVTRRPIADRVTTEEMDEAEAGWTWGCRCGGVFLVPYDTGLARTVLAPCNNCSFVLQATVTDSV
jgi:diphthamide biosynthesis protein 4